MVGRKPAQAVMVVFMYRDGSSVGLAVQRGLNGIIAVNIVEYVKPGDIRRRHVATHRENTGSRFECSLPASEIRAIRFE
jgi:hypothetical protein